jgi:hypothetical protein
MVPNATIKSGRRKIEITPLDLVIRSLMISKTTISVEWQDEK